MPDILAGHVTLLLLGGIAAGAAVAALVTWLSAGPSGGAAGAAAGLAVFTAASGWAAADLAQRALAQQAGLLVQGELLRFEAVRLRQSPSGRKLSGVAPVVLFRPTEGPAQTLRGLAGSLSGRAPGTAVPVRVPVGDPGRAVIADFHNQWSALAVVGGGAALAGLSALYFAGVCWQARRSDRRRPATRFSTWRDGPAGQEGRAVALRAAWGTLGLALLGVFVAAEFLSVARALSVALAGVAAAVACWAVAAVLRAGAHTAWTMFGGGIAVLAAAGLALLMAWVTAA